MTIRMAGALAGAVLAMGFMAGAAQAQQQTKCVSAKTDWSVCVWDSPKECWGVSAPKESVNTRGGKPAQVRRGDTMLFVTFRPGQGAKGEISFTPGYGYAKGAQVTVEIGSDKFTLFTDGEWAWPANANDDAALLAAMKKGSEAIVTGESARGTNTKDTFSLMGFSAAMQEAENRCK
ncbi:MAG: invasion associated locus B family protein [Rhodobacterales bacterium]|uniref:invasion associated locus B family protein n=1 Tax=Gemmobacter nectariphilus TaxID=220343 RepID=UPI00048975AE|nr:invasion associated locus B family protein [Gemmobacter nectariphilus]MDX5357690.1 invasion associated locus B family protein [Rhodobacterales bacterium]MDX5499944.1 invasion associated locus B family protein [Rhodobacterales bacterium]